MATLKKLVKLITNIHLPVWLLVLLSIVLVLRIPSFYEPYSYGDEMIYLTLGEAIRQKIPLYLGIHDNKPPLLYITAAIAGNLFWFKAILAFWNVITIILFWKLTQVLFPQKGRLQKIATYIFGILTTIPLLEGNIANSEVFMVGPTIAAFLILLKLSNTASNANQRKIFAAGMLFSLATLFKVPAAFDVLTIVFVWFVATSLRASRIRKILPRLFFLSLGFILPIAATFIWYFARGALAEYTIAAYLQNFGYLSAFRPGDVQESFLVRNAPLLIRALIVGMGLLILYLKRSKLTKQFLFLSSWLLFSLFAVTLSERPYPHYLIQIVPTISLFFGILLTDKSLQQSLSIIPLTLAFFVPVYFKFWYYPSASYYTRFLNLVNNRITKEQYLETFGKHVNTNYQLAEFVRMSTRKSDRIYVWGDTANIYALSRRLPPIKYVADYHISDFSSREVVAEQLTQNSPELIIILPTAPPFPELTTLLRERYIIFSTINGAEVWKETQL